MFATRPLIFKDIIHPKIKFFEPFTDLEIKTKFINTCDIMIHACSLGETFGISILEFCAKNKPIITWIPKDNDELKNMKVPFYNNQHINHLNNKGIYFNTSTELYCILTSLNYNNIYGAGGLVQRNTSEIARTFSPEKIMEDFNRVFLG